jgi:hypothetical protein
VQFAPSEIKKLWCLLRRDFSPGMTLSFVTLALDERPFTKKPTPFNKNFWGPVTEDL